MSFDELLMQDKIKEPNESLQFFGTSPEIGRILRILLLDHDLVGHSNRSLVEYVLDAVLFRPTDTTSLFSAL